MLTADLTPAQVGDFGTINRETGEFEKGGNIYEHPSTKDLAAAHQPEVSAKEESYVISSKGVKGGELDASVLTYVPRRSRIVSNRRIRDPFWRLLLYFGDHTTTTISKLSMFIT